MILIRAGDNWCLHIDNKILYRNFYVISHGPNMFYLVTLLRVGMQLCERFCAKAPNLYTFCTYTNRSVFITERFHFKQTQHSVHQQWFMVPGSLIAAVRVSNSSVSILITGKGSGIQEKPSFPLELSETRVNLRTA